MEKLFLLCCCSAVIAVFFPSAAFCWSGSIFAVPDSTSSGSSGSSGNTYRSYSDVLARTSRSLFPTYIPQPAAGFNDDFFRGSSGSDSGSSSSSSNSFNTNPANTYNNNLVPTDGGNDAISVPQQAYNNPTPAPYRPWSSQNYWWSSNVPAVSNVVRKSLDTADSPSYSVWPSSSSSSNDYNSNNNNQFAYTAPPAPATTTTTTAAPYYAAPSMQQDFAVPQPAPDFSFTYYTPSTTTTTPPVYTTQQSSQSDASPSSTVNPYFSAVLPGDSYQQQQPVQELSYLNSAYRTKINKKLSRVLAGRSEKTDYNSLFSSFEPLAGFKSTPWSIQPTAPAPEASSYSNNNGYSSSPPSAPKFSPPSAPPTSPTNQKTTEGEVDPTQTAMKQGGHLVTYTTVKKKFLRTTISKNHAKADFQDIFEKIGDPNLKPGEYMDGPFKRNESDAETNPALSMVEQDPLKSTTLQQALVDKHNVLRASVQPPAANMMKMMWNEAAAKKAAEWTAKCQFDHDAHEQRRSDHFKCGQNLARGVPDPVSWDTVVQLWFEEKNFFEMNRGPKEEAVVGHYTQLVWAQSYELGCAHTHCGSWHYYVCNYCPVGNIKSRKYEPYKVGDKCSMCPGSCDENGLCNNYCLHANDYGNCDELEQTNNICMRPDLSNKCAATCNCKNNGKLY